MTQNKEVQDHFKADKPVDSEREDRFQRYGFAKRIADTIISRKSRESIVFGLFGAWGEGKSSVLNFIDLELKKNENVISVHFNPWRYSDEDSLLKNFFNNISQALNKELQNKTEKWSNFIGKYSSGAKVFGLEISNIAKALADVELETFKERVDEFLNQANAKLVLFIDDIDRLDKQEVYTLFRLVKLNADFPNTAYILSFDENMVASAIGEKFGSGDIVAGRNFLEKIIQVPLNLPKAQPDALKKFCFNLVDNALNSNYLELSKKEIERFVYQFTTNLLLRLDTPRLAVRYGNMLSFSAPLLNGEVSMVDLMLIEAVKVFYPNHYKFIKESPEYFIGSYNGDIYGRDQQKIVEIKSHMEKLGEQLDKSEKLCITNLLSDLFPVLNTVYGNYVFSDRNYNNWYLERKIVSAKYFDRYFSYAVLEGDVSDVEFGHLIAKISTEPVELIANDIRRIVEKSLAENFIQKLRSRETEFNWNDGRKISEAICAITDLLPHNGGILGFGFETTKSQASIFIYQILKNHKSEDIFEFAKRLMILPDDFGFAYMINNWLRSGDSPDQKLFSDDQYVTLAGVLTERATTEAGKNSIFEKFPNQVYYIVPAWLERDKNTLTKYISDYLNQSDEKVLIFLKTFVPVRRVSGIEDEFKTDIDNKQYDYITSVFDKDELYNRILQNFSIDEIRKAVPNWNDRGFSPFSELNMVRQFVYYYDLNSGETNCK